MKKRKRSDFLGPVDTAFLHVDAPETPMNIGAVTIFEGKLDFDDFVEFINARVHRAPIYQKRIVQAPLNLTELMWAYDPDFNIENHVFRVELEAPGTDEQLRDLAGTLMSGMLDREKPLWEAYFIEGLSDDRTALFLKVHHCMVDGLAAVELFILLLDLTPDYTIDREKRPVYDPPPLPDATGMISTGIRRELPYKWKVLKKLGSDTLQVGSVLLDKEKRRKALFGVANLLNDNLTPISKLGINGKNSGEQSMAWVEFSLPEVRAIKNSQGASVNDVMLYVYSAGIEMYLKARGDQSPQEFLRALVPVTMREEEEKEAFGNRISVLPIDIPFDVESPLEALRKISIYTAIMKESSLSNLVDMVLTLPSLVLPVFQPLIWGLAPKSFSFLAHTWCTNVAGPQIPVYLMGHRMLHSYGYFPLNPSMGLASVIMSYNQKISINLVADKGIIPNIIELRDCLVKAYVKLRKAAKVPETEPIIITKVVAPALPESPVKEKATSKADTPEEANKGKTAGQKAKKSEKPRLFSEEWAQAYREAINKNPNYKKNSTNWEAGQLAFIMNASPRHGYSAPVAVVLDLYKGDCRGARSASKKEAMDNASFVIEGNYENWIKLLEGSAPPLPMLMRGKLKLKKGSISKLLPYSRSAQELIKSAQNI